MSQLFSSIRSALSSLRAFATAHLGHAAAAPRGTRTMDDLQREQLQALQRAQRIALR